MGGEAGLRTVAFGGLKLRHLFLFIFLGCFWLFRAAAAGEDGF